MLDHDRLEVAREVAFDRLDGGVARDLHVRRAKDGGACRWLRLRYTQHIRRGGITGRRPRCVFEIHAVDDSRRRHGLHARVPTAAAVAKDSRLCAAEAVAQELRIALQIVVRLGRLLVVAILQMVHKKRVCLGECVVPKSMFSKYKNAQDMQCLQGVSAQTQY